VLCEEPDLLVESDALMSSFTPKQNENAPVQTLLLIEAELCRTDTLLLVFVAGATKRCIVVSIASEFDGGLDHEACSACNQYGLIHECSEIFVWCGRIESCLNPPDSCDEDLFISRHLSLIEIHFARNEPLIA
jgi:hypothetical protein